MKHADFCKIINEELPEGVITYYIGASKYGFTYSEIKKDIWSQKFLKEEIIKFVEKYNGVITSHPNYYCIEAKF